MAQKNGASKSNELTKLKAENAKLRKQLAASKQTESKAPGRLWKKIGAVFFSALAVAMLVSANVIFWAGRTVIETDRYVEVTAKIIKEPAVQSALANDITNRIFERVDVQQLLVENLPERTAFLAQPLASQAEKYTEETLQKVLESQQFQSFWTQTQREVHSRVIGAIRNYEGNGVIDLNDIYQKAVGELAGTKLSFLSNTKLPSSVGSITVINATWLPTAHNVVDNLTLYRLVAFFIFLAACGLAVLLSTKKRKQVITLALLLVFSMFATLVAVRLTQNQIVASATAQNQEAVRTVSDILFSGLILQTRLILASGLIIAFLAWISGPYRTAAVIRERINRLLSGKVHETFFGNRENTVTRFVGRNQMKIFWTYTATIAVLIVILSISTASLISFVVSVAIVAVLLEILAEPQK